MLRPRMAVRMDSANTQQELRAALNKHGLCRFGSAPNQLCDLGQLTEPLELEPPPPWNGEPHVHLKSHIRGEKGLGKAPLSTSRGRG